MDQVSMVLLGSLKERENGLVTLAFEEAAFSALRWAMYIHSATDEPLAEFSTLSVRYQLIGCFEGLYQFMDRASRHTFTVSNLGEICVEAVVAAAGGSVRG